MVVDALFCEGKGKKNFKKREKKEDACLLVLDRFQQTVEKEKQLEIPALLYIYKCFGCTIMVCARMPLSSYVFAAILFHSLLQPPLSPLFFLHLLPVHAIGSLFHTVTA